MKIIYLIIGFIALVLGSIGAVLPILPTVPFFILATFCFTRGSDKIDRWFKNTAIYKKYLGSYLKGQGMTLKNKVKIMIYASFFLAIGFFVAEKIFAARLIIFIVWVLHIIYFFLIVKTITR